MPDVPRQLPVAALLILAIARVDAQAVRLTPRVALVDDSVRITASGLRSGSQATIRARRTDTGGQVWESAVEITADTKGLIDLAQMAPTSGSYSGKAPMGLFTSMDVLGENRGRSRYPFKWSDTLRTAVSLEVGGRVLAVDTLVQTFSAPGVRMRPVHDSGLVATLFTPARPGRTPGVVVLGGSEGGLSGEDVAASLASHGYAALAVGYFGVERLPPALDEIPIEYFERAIRLFERDGSVAPGGIAILGTSKGAEAALIVAALDSEVTAVVAYQPSNVVWSCICGAATHSSWSVGGTSLPFVPPGTNPDYRPPAGSPIRPTENYRYRLRDSSAASRAEIAVERIRGPIVLIAGGDDGLWPSLSMARAILARRRQLGVSKQDALLEYSGAGHLIGKAYLPVGSTLVGGGRLETGGSVQANAAAQADSWPRVLEFLRNTTGKR